MAKRYWTLCTRDGGKGSPWAPQFGDYERDTVVSERDDYRDGFQQYRAKDMAIIVTLDDQDSINAGVARLNRSK